MTASPRFVALAAVALVLATFAAYHNSLAGPFVFDDRAAILENSTIRRLWPLSDPLSPPTGGTTVSGRPLVNLSLAFNHRLGGIEPRGYHVFNVMIHALGGLVLFGIVRRTWARRTKDTAESDSATVAALGAALLWTLHPLQTAAVTYVVQRAELLMGLCYLLTMYSFIRGVDTECGRGWFALAVLACAAGMACKEVMVTAPLVVLLYDRTFVTGSFSIAWRHRGFLYVALAATWGLSAWLWLSSGSRGGTVGFGSGVSWWHYLLTQSEAIARYLKLSVWPHPLVFDHGERVVTHLADVLPQAVLVLALMTGVVVALRCKPAAGFLGAWFFIILAPTSSVIPVASHTIAEHRMYLPLAAVMVGVVMALRALAGAKAWIPVLLLTVAAGGFTFARNRTYGSEIALWANTAARLPGNVRAQVNLGSALLDAGRFEEAAAAYKVASQLRPDSADVRVNLCHVYARLGRLEEAIKEGEAALRLEPSNPNAHINLATALAESGQVDAAISHYNIALRLQPEAADLAQALADVLVHRAQNDLRQGRRGEAAQSVQDALRLMPDHVEAHFVQGNVSAAAENFSAAMRSYGRVLQLEPGHSAARGNLANCQLVTGQFAQAAENYEALLRANPGDAAVQQNLAVAREMERSGSRGLR